MGITVTRVIRCAGAGALKAFCDVAVGELLIKGVRVIEGRRGPFVRMPRQQSKNGTWYDSVVPLSNETQAEISRVVLETFARHLASSAAKDPNGR